MAQKSQIAQGNALKFLILILTGVLAFLALIIPNSINQSEVPMNIGDVVPQDILAPYSLTYESKILTDKAKQDAADAIEPIYLPIDPSIGRRQVENLRAELDFISIVRQDSFATADEKIADINALENINLSSEMIQQVLQLNDDRWSAIMSEATNVLEQIMRNTMKPDDISQSKIRTETLIDYSFPEDHTNIVVELVHPFIVPNSLYSEEQTEEAILAAEKSVEPIVRSFIAGETLVRRGEIIRDTDWEALERFGLIQPENQTQEIIGAGTLTVVLGILVGLYFKLQKRHGNYSIKSLLLISVAFLLFLGIARFLIVGRTIVPYVYPLAAFGLTLSIIFNFEVAVILSIILGFFVTFRVNNTFDLTIFYIVPGILGMLVLGKAKRIASFFISGIAIGLAGVAIILAFRLPDSVTDWIGIATLSGASIINGIGSASVTLLMQYVFSQVLGITTPLQLLEISRPDHPLLQQMLRNAPGSYQHALQVANLAEQAAEAIGADSLLVRVGALFHDCGKSKNPQFFIENQVQDKIDSHDDIDPLVSAQTIIAHVNDGVALAKKYRLPKRIIDFIREHHGTMYTHYQYSQAVNESGNNEAVDKSQFTYPGPKPQSRETALLMLADGTEARARSVVPKNEDDLRTLIDTVFDFYINNNQLEDTNLTLTDLKQTKQSFFRTLQGSYHPRVKYPDLEKK